MHYLCKSLVVVDLYYYCGMIEIWLLLTLPYDVKPPCLMSYFGASALLESAHGVLHVEVSVIYRTPNE